MIKTAVDRGEELLSNPPGRNEEALVEWIGNLKTSKRDLVAELNDPRTRMGDRNAAITASVLSEVEQKLLQADAILEAIRMEVPQREFVEAEANGQIDYESSVENLAVASATSTIGLNNWDRFSRGMINFETELEPKIEPDFVDFPREKYAERLKELIAMDDGSLSKLAAEKFPTDEWIGKEGPGYGGEGDLGNIPTHFEKDPTTPPEDKDIDGEFEDAISKERKFRGIEEASTSAKEAGIKKANNPQELADLLKSMGLEGDQINQVVNVALKEMQNVDYSGGPGEDPDYFDDKAESFSNTVTNDAGETRYAKSAAGVSDPDPGSHEPSSSSDGGAQMQAKPPEPEEAFENVMLNEGEKGQSAPRGPNRRTGKDVPAYSTPTNKLTAALKLQSMYQNMTEEQAWEIVNTVYANEDAAEENATGSGEEASDHDVVKNEDDSTENNSEDNDLEGLFDD